METRQCIVCKQIKPIEEFNYRRRSTGERHGHCRDCQRLYKRNFYLRTRSEYIGKSARQKQAVVRHHLELLNEYLSTHPCVDCGESDPVVLEFDHITEKDRTIADMVQSGVSWERILGEIEKCQVRCGNCHKKKTAQEMGWYKFPGL